MNWSDYHKLLVTQVEETRHNLDHAENQVEKAKAFHELAVWGLESFEKALDEKMDSLEKTQVKI